MKEIIIKIPVTKVVKHKDKVMYETEDGRQFSTVKQAKDWEAQLEI